MAERSWSSRHGDAEYQAGLRALQARRKAFLRQTEGRKVRRVNLPAFADGHNIIRGDNIYDIARQLLADAPHQWPNGAGLEDVIDTYGYRKGPPQGTLSMYGIIGEIAGRS
jgi:hypothetical protein